MTTTIVAQATPIGTGAVAVIRLSGPKSLIILDHLFRTKQHRPRKSFPPRLLCYGLICDPRSGATIDEVLGVFMPAPHSFTGEDVVEIHCHGGEFISAKLLHVILEQGAELAEAGEFTKRAFLNGRIDLTQAEAIGEAISAKNEWHLAMAQQQMAGQLGQTLNSYRQELIALLSYVQALIDFPEEDDVVIEMARIQRDCRRLQQHFDQLIASYEDGRIVANGIKTVIMGRPNVGKSSLFNALLNEKRAIVTDIPGTTRDALEAQLRIRGKMLLLTDTAGIRQTTDRVELEGIKLAREKIDSADLLLWIVALDDMLGLADDLGQYALPLQDGRRPVIFIFNKADLLPGNTIEAMIQPILTAWKIVDWVVVSLHNPSDLVRLREKVWSRCQTLLAAHVRADTSELMLLKERQREALVRASRALERANIALADQLSPEFIAIEIQDALTELGHITGQVVYEEILDHIFSHFCIGK
jgi:tRNA modification GTPase